MAEVFSSCDVPFPTVSSTIPITPIYPCLLVPFSLKHNNLPDPFSGTQNALHNRCLPPLRCPFGGTPILTPNGTCSLSKAGMPCEA